MALQFRHDLLGDQFFALRTFRKDGSAVSTPIWLAPSSGCWYGYTPRRSWKIKRIRANSHVEIAQSSFLGQLRKHGGRGVGIEITLTGLKNPDQ